MQCHKNNTAAALCVKDAGVQLGRRLSPLALTDFGLKPYVALVCRL